MAFPSLPVSSDLWKGAPLTVVPLAGLSTATLSLRAPFTGWAGPTV